MIRIEEISSPWRYKYWPTWANWGLKFCPIIVSSFMFFIPLKNGCLSKVSLYMVIATLTLSWGGSYSMKLLSSATAILLS